jgi:signal transduction histidine kinase
MGADLEMSRLLRSPIVIGAVLVTAVFWLIPSIHTSTYAPGLRILLESVTAISALIAAAVVFGRFRRSGTLDELWLIVSLVLLSASGVAVAAFVAVESAPRVLLVIAVSARLVGALALATAAFSPVRPLRRPHFGPVVVSLGTLALVAALTAVFAAWIKLLPGTQLHVLADAGTPYPDRVTPISIFHALTLAAFLAAAVGLARRYTRTQDEFFHWVAVAAVLAATARMHYLLSPPAGKYWLHSGEVFVLLSYCVLVYGATREILTYWRGAAETAVLDERRRIARELHDSVAQELAFIARRARRLSPQDASVQISAAADRALLDSRRAIAALTRPLDEPLDVALAQATEDVAARTGARIELELEPGVVIEGSDAREALVRIACEAVANAARHADATSVRVELSNGDRIRLRVVDDGVGFDPDTAESGTLGFGLVSMRERAAALGADFAVRSRPGGGTAVEVEL